METGCVVPPGCPEPGIAQEKGGTGGFGYSCASEPGFKGGIKTLIGPCPCTEPCCGWL